MMLILQNVPGKKSVIFLKYKPFTDVLQRLNLDNKNTFFRAASVYQASE